MAKKYVIKLGKLVDGTLKGHSIRGTYDLNLTLAGILSGYLKMFAENTHSIPMRLFKEEAERISPENPPQDGGAFGAEACSAAEKRWSEILTDMANKFDYYAEHFLDWENTEAQEKAVKDCDEALSALQTWFHDLWD